MVLKSENFHFLQRNRPSKVAADSHYSLNEQLLSDFLTSYKTRIFILLVFGVDHFLFPSFQSDLACLESKSSTLESEHRRLTSKLLDVEKRLQTTEKELDEEKQKRKSETEILAKKLAELSKQVF